IPASDIYHITFSPDGQRLATANQNGTATIWNAVTGDKELTLLGHKDAVRSIAFSPCTTSPGVSAEGCGTRVVTTSDDRTGGAWDLTRTEELAAWPGRMLGVASDGVRLTMLSGDNPATVSVRELSAGLSAEWDAGQLQFPSSLPIAMSTLNAVALSQ